MDAVLRNNASAGAGYIERSGEKYLIRVPGQVEDAECIRRIVVAPRDGLPLRIGDVAEVGEGTELRTGARRQKTAARSCSVPSSCWSAKAAARLRNAPAIN